MKQKSHEIKLRNGLIINLADKPHIIGRAESGSDKVVCFSQWFYNCLWAVLRCILSTLKASFQPFKVYPLERIQEDTEAILKLLKLRLQAELKTTKIVAKAVKTAKKSVRGYDISFISIVVVADEIEVSAVAVWTQAEKGFWLCSTQIVQKGGLYLFLSSRDAKSKTDTTLFKWHLEVSLRPKYC